MAKAPTREDRITAAREVTQALAALHVAVRIAISHEISRKMFFELAKSVWKNELEGDRD